MQDVVTPQLGHLPPALENRPILYEGLEFVLSAFNILTRGRLPGEPLKVSEIVSYATSTGVIDIDLFIILIQAADEGYRDG